MEGVDVYTSKPGLGCVAAPTTLLVSCVPNPDTGFPFAVVAPSCHACFNVCALEDVIGVDRNWRTSKK